MKNNRLFAFCFRVAAALFSIFMVTIVAFRGFVYPIMEPGRTSGRRFPYFFLDFYELGFVAAVYVVGIMVFFLALNYLLYWFDKKKR